MAQGFWYASPVVQENLIVEQKFFLSFDMLIQAYSVKLDQPRVA